MMVEQLVTNHHFPYMDGNPKVRLTGVPAIVQPTGMEANFPDISSRGNMMPVSSNLDVFDKAIQVYMKY